MSELDKEQRILNSINKKVANDKNLKMTVCSFCNKQSCQVEIEKCAAC